MGWRVDHSEQTGWKGGKKLSVYFDTIHLTFLLPFPFSPLLLFLLSPILSAIRNRREQKKRLRERKEREEKEEDGEKVGGKI